MLLHPVIEQLKSLRLHGMATALSEQLQSATLLEMSTEERLGLLVEREIVDRNNRRLSDRLRRAQLREQACLEDMDYAACRGLDKSMVTKLGLCQWIAAHHNVVVSGATGTGKSYLACALAHRACLQQYTARYVRLPRLLEELSLARGDGRYKSLLASFAKIDLLVLDDWGLLPLTEGSRRDLLEILEDRYQKCSTVVTSQLPLADWHESIGDPTLADAILDRLVHNAYKIALQGPSMRKTKAPTLSDEEKPNIILTALVVG